ncbi:Uncharacterised protein [Mycobacterium tuberculosis]|nr:Uncharacterised protein [Mycobacterium tuberculosis]
MISTPSSLASSITDGTIRSLNVPVPTVSVNFLSSLILSTFRSLR